MKKYLTHIGNDSWGRHVYEDENGRIWKSTNFRKYDPEDIYNSDRFDGEPDCPIRSGIEILFVDKDLGVGDEYL